MYINYKNKLFKKTKIIFKFIFNIIELKIKTQQVVPPPCRKRRKTFCRCTVRRMLMQIRISINVNVNGTQEIRFVL